jgi:hypothetical protein
MVMGEFGPDHFRAVSSLPVQLPVSLRVSPVPVQSSFGMVGQQQAEGIVPFTERDCQFLNAWSATERRASHGETSSNAARELSLKLKNEGRFVPQPHELYQSVESSSSMKVVVERAQNVCLTRRPSAVVDMENSTSFAKAAQDEPMSAESGARVLNIDSVTMNLGKVASVSGEPRPCADSPGSSPKAVGQKRDREAADSVQKPDAPLPTKRLRARLPCVDQYVAVRKDLDVLLGAVAGGLSPQQGVMVAAALRELAAR